MKEALQKNSEAISQLTSMMRQQTKVHKNANEVDKKVAALA